MDLGFGAILLFDVTAVVALLAEPGLRYTGVWVGWVILFFCGGGGKLQIRKKKLFETWE